jgi:hypothetical protein
MRKCVPDRALAASAAIAAPSFAGAQSISANHHLGKAS